MATSSTRRRPGSWASLQSFGIAFASLRKRNDFLGDNFVGKVAAISEPKRHQGHFERAPNRPAIL
jgi:hypothetical protein